MKTFWYISALVLVFSFLLIRSLSGQNNIASNKNDRKDYFAFNWSEREQSRNIMDYWKADEHRSEAVKNIVYLDYAFMLVYSLYFFFSIRWRYRTERVTWLKQWLRLAMPLILLSLLLDFIQDSLILHYVTSNAPVMEMRRLTVPKWAAFVAAVLPLLLSILRFYSVFVSKSLRFMSQLLKAISLFFPGLLFLLLSILCFWTLGQGKDIMVAFINNASPGTTLVSHSAPFFFFVIIGFWVYVSWYSSRIIAYIKKNQQQQKIRNITGNTEEQVEVEYNNQAAAFDIGKPFLDGFPRFIGNTCFLVLELAVLQLVILTDELPALWPWLSLILLLIMLHFFNKWIDRKMEKNFKIVSANASVFSRTFWILLSSLFLYVAVLCFYPSVINIWSFLGLLVLFHVVFTYYIHLRRLDLEQYAPVAKYEADRKKERGIPLTMLERLMEYFCIPLREKGYYRWFLIIALTGSIIYLSNVVSIVFARHIGPFPTVILGFAMLLAFGNVVTAFSVRYKVNFHLILFMLAFLISSIHETHYVGTKQASGNNNKYTERPCLKDYLATWLNNRKVPDDSISKEECDMYFVLANGGASRSGYWTAAVLGSLEDSSLAYVAEHPGASRFSDHIFCLSGTSGGGVGVATFFALLRDREKQKQPKYTESAKAFLMQDYFSYTFARLLGPDYFSYIFPLTSKKDRAAALEESFELSCNGMDTGLYQVPFSDLFSTFRASDKGKFNLPILCINTTRVQDGNPGVVTNLRLDSATFNNRVDVVSRLDGENDITITSAAILGARFPYLSPAGRINKDYFVDGGYFDNSGAGVVQEMIRGIINIGKLDSMDKGSTHKLSRQISRLHFKVLHITNSPVITDNSNPGKVAPIKNDLLAPVLTIIGAYDMQTTVNDGRLVNFIKDLDTFKINKAHYNPIALYKDTSELDKDTIKLSEKTLLYGKERKDSIKYIPEQPYAMNWFMSDYTRNRIDDRLRNHEKLKALIKEMNH